MKMRLEYCLACGGKLPDGSRIDRKYCRAACIERAYYQRHPHKKRVPGSSRQRAAEVDARSSRLQHEDANKLVRLTADNLTLSQQLQAAQEKIATLETARQRSAAKSTASIQTQIRVLEAAHQKIAQLEKQLQASMCQVNRFQDEAAQLRRQHQIASRVQSEALEQAERQGARYKEQFFESAGETFEVQEKLKHAEGKIALLEAQIAASLRTSNCERMKREHTDQAPTGPAPAMRVSQKAAESFYAQKSSPAPYQSAFVPQSANQEPSPMNEVRPPLPWEWPAKPEIPSPHPKWGGLPPAQIDTLRTFVLKAIAELPKQIRKSDGKANAEKMAQYINAPGNMPHLEALSLPFCARIICTDRSHRKTERQLSKLVPLALKDTIGTLIYEGYAGAHELRDAMIAESQFLLWFALEMAIACGIWRIEPNSTQ